MQITNHAAQRMNQRGITKEMLELVIQYGQSQDEKTTLSRDAAARLVAELQCQAEERGGELRKIERQMKALARLVAELQRQAEERGGELRKIERQMKTAKKVLDKGGITIVSDPSDETVISDETKIITTYNCNPQKKRVKWQGKRNQSCPRNEIERAFGSHNQI
ncbi:DUF4258 domain-containing protein [Microcoleus sp. FACHB-672]|uniref:DUF4258 domain-containing protein n=1 Tax=Microcoleus sp. FACHB-672 TaxID=2692825 RepID=UPI001689BE7A|nr:DUF4258 domain-containing protein [Microcoleus sp. FACHB-672]MBD2041490.1 DUF4258 domain-containing protein [Microcoleus sp. FACHB-672]